MFLEGPPIGDESLLFSYSWDVKISGMQVRDLKQ